MGMSDKKVAAWGIVAFIIAVMFAVYLYLLAKESFAYFIVVVAYFVALAGIYKEKV